jgi:CheY-like chemotaxis protein
MQGNVLIVDDDQDARKLLTMAFNYLGWHSEAVPNGARALDSMKQHLPDLIMLDLMMPEMNGFEMLGRLKADPHTRNIPVIIMSAMGSDQRIRRLGASMVMTKGHFTVNGLCQAVNEVVGPATASDHEHNIPDRPW